MPIAWHRKVVDNVAEALKRLAVRLSPDHWIFSVAPRERVAYIRQALDMAMLVNRRFDRIEELLRCQVRVEEPQKAPEAPGTFVADILNSICDL